VDGDRLGGGKDVLVAQPDFTIKQNDTASRLQSTLTNSGGTAVSIQNATILFKMAPIAGGTLTAAGTATIDQVGDGSGTAGAMGQLHYDWTASASSQAGLYAGEWQVTFASGIVQTFPNGDPMLISIPADL
jgi:hypothetical protein